MVNILYIFYNTYNYFNLSHWLSMVNYWSIVQKTGKQPLSGLSYEPGRESHSRSQSKTIWSSVSMLHPVLRRPFYAGWLIWQHPEPPFSKGVKPERNSRLPFTITASTPDGIRTRIAGVKDRCPEPLDDRSFLVNWWTGELVNGDRVLLIHHFTNPPNPVAPVGIEPTTPGLKDRCSAS